MRGIALSRLNMVKVNFYMVERFKTKQKYFILSCILDGPNICMCIPESRNKYTITDRFDCIFFKLIPISLGMNKLEPLGKFIWQLIWISAVSF